MEKEIKQIREMYVYQGLTGVEIAEKLGYKSAQTIYNKMEKVGIERRDRSECQNPFEINREELEYEYLKKSMSMNEIAQKHGVSAETIRRSIKEYGIPAKDNTWKCAGWNKGKPMSEKQKKDLSETRKRLYAEGKIEHWNEGNHWDKETRQKISNSLLQGRKPAPQYYGSDWKVQRTSCLQRDGYKCQQCGSGLNLEVHHWEPYRFCYDNSLSNLVTLCGDCHDEKHKRYKKEGFIQEAEMVFYG